MAKPGLSEISQVAEIIAAVAVVVSLIIGVLKKKRLRKRLEGRGQQVSSRRAERYLENFEHIWDLQSFLLDEADHFDVPIIENTDAEEAIRAIMHTLSVRIAEELKLRPAPSN